MSLIWKKACLDDLEDLVAVRVIVLRAANGLDAAIDMGETAQRAREYYTEALTDGSHAAYLVQDGEAIIGAGGVSFYRVMPTYHNPTGRKAYIMNMYTAPAYRRKGIARKTLALLVEEARSRGIGHIALESTEAGRPLYEAFGFEAAENEMILPEK